MMQQYHDAKEVAGDALLLFRMGDFYELFHDDAKTAARVLGLTLTSRDKGENPVPMAGFPHHQLDGYLAKIIAAGLRAAVCEQVEDPKLAKGLVKREITRLVSPGTLIEDELLNPHECNYLASVALPVKSTVDEVGLAWADLSTGRFWAAVFPRAQMADQLVRIQPAECLVSDEDPPLPPHLARATMVTKRPRWAFGYEAAEKALTKQFGAASLEGFGFGETDTLAVRAAGAVLDYLTETQKSSLDHIDRLIPFRVGGAVEIDEATRRSLELSRTMREGKRQGSLLWAIDRTVTPMGARLLGEWLAAPLTDLAAIERRLDTVEQLHGAHSVCEEFRRELREVYDLERLLARVATGRATPRDLSFIGRTLRKLPAIHERLLRFEGTQLQALADELDRCEDLLGPLEAALVDDCPLSARDGGLIRSGYHPPLDELRELAAGGKQWIAQYQARIAAETNLPQLKVGYNKVFGYYLELSQTHAEKAPDYFIRKQTLKNAERYITPELKEYEEKVLTADDESREMEYQLFVQLRDQVQGASRRLRATAQVLAQLDVLLGLAELARQRSYCRPVMVPENVLDIREGRHPVLDLLEPQGTFVPNDTLANPDEGMILLITGPNMAGKSTYIRQVALISLLAHLGSFVPAQSAKIGLIDRIFARVGASDELSRGQSTFMVEMTETARILNTATGRSLVILDEIGRGTSTYDGISLAWAIVEHIHDRLGCRTLFATHYHELTDLQSTLGGIRNLNVAVQEWEDNVVFLHKIVPGAADKSYGIHVARLAGVPREVNERAKQILSQLESEHLDPEGRPKISARGKKRTRRDIQLTLFAPYDHPLLDKIRQTKIDSLTPLQALEMIQTWQRELEASS